MTRNVGNTQKGEEGADPNVNFPFFESIEGKINQAGRGTGQQIRGRVEWKIAETRVGVIDAREISLK